MFREISEGINRYSILVALDNSIHSMFDHEILQLTLFTRSSTQITTEQNNSRRYILLVKYPKGIRDL